MTDFRTPSPRFLSYIPGNGHSLHFPLLFLSTPGIPHRKSLQGDPFWAKTTLRCLNIFSQLLAQPLKENFSMSLHFSQGAFGLPFSATCLIGHSSFLPHLFVFLAYNNIHILSNKKPASQKLVFCIPEVFSFFGGSLFRLG